MVGRNQASDRGVALDEERRQPRRRHVAGVRQQPLARGLAVCPERPHGLGHQDERRDVVAVHDRDGSEGIKRPPPKPALIEGEEQRQGGDEDERGDQSVGAAPGRVIDLERADREPGGRPLVPAARPTVRRPNRPAARSRCRPRGGDSQRNRQIVAAREQPLQHEPEAVVSSGSCTTDSTAPERVVVDDRVQLAALVEAGLKR